MDKRGWNAYDLSNASRVPQPTIQRFLSGKHGDPRSNTIKKIAVGLKISEAKLRGFDNTEVSEKTTSYLSSPGFTFPANVQVIQMPFMAWSEYCENTDSINKKELDFMMIDNEINISEEIYAIDIDTNTFKEFPAGTRILIDPLKKPEKNKIIVLTIGDGIQTLVRWNPGLGLLQVEPLESGYPNSISLEGKNYTVLGVAVWQHHKGGCL